MSTLKAWAALNRHGLPTSFYGIAERSGWPTPLAIAALDLSGIREDAAAAVHLSMMGQPDDYIRARAMTWQQRLA